MKVTATDPDNPAAKLRATDTDRTTSDVVSRNFKVCISKATRIIAS